MTSRRWRAVAAGAVVVALVCAGGWYLEATQGAEAEFVSCMRTAPHGSLKLTFVHSPGQEFEFSRTPHGNGDVTVSVRLVESGGMGPAIGINTTLAVDDLSGRVFAHDGEEIECQRVAR